MTLSKNTPVSPIKLLLVDDHFIVRLGLASSLNDEPDMRVVAEAGTVAEALSLVPSAGAQVAVIDMNLPDGHGPELVAKMRVKQPELRCLMLSVNTGENDVQLAVRAGAHGYLSKAVERAELLDAIRALAAGDTYFPAAIRRILDQSENRPDLSNREVDVLALIVEGRLNKEIADRLQLAEITVKQHVSSILRKLGVQDRTQAAIAAIERGLIRIKK